MQRRRKASPVWWFRSSPIFSASPSSELLNPNHTGIIALLVSLRIRSSLQSARQIKANFEFGTLALGDTPCQRGGAGQPRLGSCAGGDCDMLGGRCRCLWLAACGDRGRHRGFGTQRPRRREQEALAEAHVVVEQVY